MERLLMKLWFEFPSAEQLCVGVYTILCKNEEKKKKQPKGSVQFLSHVRLFAAPWTPAHQASLSITSSQSLLKLMSIESVMPSNQLILCHPLLLLPSIFPSIRVFSSESVLHIRWSKYWSFSFSISPENIQDWFPLGWTGAVQGTLESLLQHHSSKASVLWCSAFFIVQLSAKVSQSYPTLQPHGKSLEFSRPEYWSG